jgi:hypothetical protein
MSRPLNEHYAERVRALEAEIARLHAQLDAERTAWEAAASATASEVGALRELYRAGDVSGMAAALDAGGAPLADVLVGAILSPRAAVLLLINTRALNDTYNDLCCALDLSACHFSFAPTAIAAVTLALPAGLAGQGNPVLALWVEPNVLAYTQGLRLAPAPLQPLSAASRARNSRRRPPRL